MTEPYAYQAHQAEHGPAGPWLVRLLLEAPSLPERTAFLAARARRGPVQPMTADDLSVVLPQRRVVVEESSVPSAHMIVLEASVARDLLVTALGQVWDWSEARVAVARATAGALVAEMLAHDIPRDARLAEMLATVQALAEHADAVAVHWLPSDRLVSPAALLAATATDALTSVAVNVRLFRVEGRPPGEVVMDSLGMAAFGLPDVQCHFAGLDPGAVAGLLYGYADYLFANGDVIADGDTVDGVGGRPWLARHEDALVGPPRVVLDLDPGADHGARRR